MSARVVDTTTTGDCRHNLRTRYRLHPPTVCQEGMTVAASIILTTGKAGEVTIHTIIMASMAATMISKTGTKKTGGGEILTVVPIKMQVHYSLNSR